MTEPYTAEELQRVASQVEDAVREAGGYGSGPDLARLAATLREYERVVEEREALKDLIKARYSNMTLPAGYNVLDFLILWHTQEKTARQKAEAEVAALRADKERMDWLENKEGRPGGVQSAYWSVCWNGPDGHLRGYKYRRGKVPFRVVGVKDSLRDAVDAARAAEEG